MNFCEVVKDTTHYLELLVTDSNGEPVTGLSVSYTVYKSSDDSIFASGSLTEIGSSGIYKASIIFSITGQYRIFYNTPSGYTDEIETVQVVVAGEQAISDMLQRLLGLCHDNVKIVDEEYDRYNNLIESTVNIYPSATDLENETNLLYQYKMTSVWNNKRQMREYKFKRII